MNIQKKGNEPWSAKMPSPWHILFFTIASILLALTIGICINITKLTENTQIKETLAATKTTKTTKESITTENKKQENIAIEKKKQEDLSSLKLMIKNAKACNIVYKQNKQQLGSHPLWGCFTVPTEDPLKSNESNDFLYYCKEEYEEIVSYATKQDCLSLFIIITQRIIDKGTKELNELQAIYQPDETETNESILARENNTLILYREDATKERYIYYQTDGVTKEAETFYRENGTKKQTTHYYSDGVTKESETLYREDGTNKQTIYYYNDGVTKMEKTLYRENGTSERTIGYYDEEKYEETFYRKDSTRKLYIYYQADGKTIAGKKCYNTNEEQILCPKNTIKK